MSGDGITLRWSRRSRSSSFHRFISRSFFLVVIHRVGAHISIWSLHTAIIPSFFFSRLSLRRTCREWVIRRSGNPDQFIGNGLVVKMLPCGRERAS